MDRILNPFAPYEYSALNGPIALPFDPVGVEFAGGLSALSGTYEIPPYMSAGVNAFHLPVETEVITVAPTTLNCVSTGINGYLSVSVLKPLPELLAEAQVQLVENNLFHSFGFSPLDVGEFYSANSLRPDRIFSLRIPSSFQQSLVSHSEFSSLIAYNNFLSIAYVGTIKRVSNVVVDSVTAFFGDRDKLGQTVQNRTACCALREGTRRTHIFKPLHTPVRVNRESLRPIELAA